jgi:hypothetical protein
VAPPKTLVVNFVLDETGSMQLCADATISGFNEYIGDLAKRTEPVRFTLTKFNSTKIDVVHVGVPVAQVARLSRANYHPSDLTPLYDAIARTIKETDQAIVGIGDHAVLCVIMTDGQENASHEYDRNAIFALIKEKEAAGWTFAFLGADQDAWETGQQMGIPGGNTMSYAGTPAGTTGAMKGVATASATYLASGGVPTADFFGGGQGAPPAPPPPPPTPAPRARRRGQKPKLRDW